MPKAIFSPLAQSFLSASSLLARIALVLFCAAHVHAQSTGWKTLFNGKDLSGWKTNDFAGGGEVKVEDGKIIIGTGVALTGFKRTNDLLRSNYEVLIEA